MPRTEDEKTEADEVPVTSGEHSGETRDPEKSTFRHDPGGHQGHRNPIFPIGHRGEEAGKRGEGLRRACAKGVTGESVSKRVETWAEH
ncbi:hypothetical protein NDU88_008223 [Pleurodeles waltl]|uniref:Uncharacterized protein n=1 Tax=Pleurodeles waltl TaxID=8319 RepID=A0AAV7VUV9_PLEWA|nr:hypothetical protein NDU88_008223 [Pleurodeles waltl]